MSGFIQALSVINCAFSAQSLKFAVGGKLYLQPIQNNLSLCAVKRIQESNTSAVKQKCRFCNDEMYVIDFSDHLKECNNEEFGDPVAEGFYIDDAVLEQPVFSHINKDGYLPLTEQNDEQNLMQQSPLLTQDKEVEETRTESANKSNLEDKLSRVCEIVKISM